VRGGTAPTTAAIQDGNSERSRTLVRETRSTAAATARGEGEMRTVFDWVGERRTWTVRKWKGVKEKRMEAGG